MPYTVEFDSQQEMIVVRITGRLDPQGGLAATADAIKLAEQHQAYRYLFDVTGATVDADPMDVYEMPDKIRAMGATARNRVAIVFQKDLVTYEFLENVAHNRGQTVKTFENTDDAIQWLLDTGPNS